MIYTTDFSATAFVTYFRLFVPMLVDKIYSSTQNMHLAALMKLFFTTAALVCVLAGAQTASAAGPGTVRICDDSGCSDRPRSSTTIDPNAGRDSEAERRIKSLEALAEKDPRAAYDLGLRFFRGEGVRQDSYSALKWMRDAAERGQLQAQLAVGRFYLMGLEEMGSDPAEAEKWLSMAAGRGDREATKLLAEAQAAKKTERDYYAWRQANRNVWYGWWYSGYPYYSYWGPGGWYYR
jgi:uncharacterized protein